MITLFPAKPKGKLKGKPTADDWKVIWNEEYDPYVFPSQIATTNARPDLVIWSYSTRTCIVVELTVCWEENFQQAHERKRGKKDYVDIISQGRQKGWTVRYFPVEGGARGVQSDSLGYFLRFMGFSRRKACQAADTVENADLQASYTLSPCGSHETRLLHMDFKPSESVLFGLYSLPWRRILTKLGRTKFEKTI